VLARISGSGLIRVATRNWPNDMSQELSARFERESSLLSGEPGARSVQLAKYRISPVSARTRWAY